MPLKRYADTLERLYRRLNRPRYVHPDPLEFLYRYEDPKDREVTGLIAASLAFGRVGQILKSVDAVLGRMGGRPARFLHDARPSALERRFEGFVHRTWRGGQLAALLVGMRGVIRRFGSLGACFIAGDGKAGTVLPALQTFVERLDPAGRCGSLLPRPAGRSACKRLHLYLRWMVRRDRVDPGGWDAVSASRLIVPLDTHMHRVGRLLGATGRKTACLPAAMEITEAFRRISPEDPVRYDFVLTRLGIRPDGNLEEFLRRCRIAGAEGR